jgi:3-oxoacyl-[acyl-carrier protein] reductase
MSAEKSVTYPDLAGKIAVVTGGSGSIGAATALELSENGVSVVVVGRDTTRVDAAVAAVRAIGGDALGVIADCTSENDLAALREQAEAHFGTVDILVAFAGGQGMPVPTASETAAHWRAILESDLTATFLTTSAFLPGMVNRGSGTIITMASAAARQAAKSAAAYAAAKAGVIAFTRHLAGEDGGSGIRANCVAPSAIETERMRTWVSEADRGLLGASFPLGRIGQPDDVAAATLFLASSESSWITGITLDIAGGKVMQ